MPRSRIYTDSGYLEVQWQKDGDLICIVSGQKVYTESTGETIETMHQFISKDREDIARFNSDIRRALRQTRDLTAGPSGSLVWKFNWEEFQKLEDSEKNVFLGIPADEIVEDRNYRALFEEQAI